MILRPPRSQYKDPGTTTLTHNNKEYKFESF